MNPLLKRMLSRYMAPAGDDGSDAGGTETIDRGDDFIGTDDDGPEPQAAVAPPAAATPADAGFDDPADDADEPAADPKAKREPRIPLARHEAVLAKERARRTELEQQLAQFQQGGQVAALNQDITKAEDNILSLEQEYVNLLADGELEKAAAKNAQIRALERQMGEAKSDMKIAAAEARATERARYGIALERIESAYPELNEDHADFDPGMMEDVIDLKAAYESKGMTPTTAMQKAVDKLIGYSTKRQEAALDTTPRVGAKDVAAERKKEGVTRTLAAVNGQPPSAARVGLDSDKAGGSLTAKDVIRLGQEEFSKLPESALAKMRGDEL